MLDYCVIIPAHNEAQYLPLLLDSLTQQALLPKQSVIVNDHSTDETEAIIDRYSKKFPWITKVNSQTEASRLPGSKVVAAFDKGLKEIDQPYDFIVKFSDLEQALVVIIKKERRQLQQTFSNHIMFSKHSTLYHTLHLETSCVVNHVRY